MIQKIDKRRTAVNNQVLDANKIIQQWEPQIHKILQTWFIPGMDKEDLVQELRIVIIKCAKKFDDSRGVKFHTYLYNAFKNYLGILKHKNKMNSLIDTYDEFPQEAGKFFTLYEDESDEEIESHIQAANLSLVESFLLDVFLCGYKFSEILAISESPKILKNARKTLKQKMEYLLQK